MRHFALSAIFLSLLGSSALADSETTICMYSGGPTPCPADADSVLSWEDYNARYGGPDNATIHAKMAAEFCTFMDNGTQKTYPYNVVQTVAAPGGEHGTGVWLVRCIY